MTNPYILRITVYKTHPLLEAKSDGVDRTVLTLNFGGNEPDVKAMLSLYDNPEGIIIKDEASPNVAQNGFSTQEKGESKGQSSPESKEEMGSKEESTQEKGESTQENGGSKGQSTQEKGESTQEKGESTQEKGESTQETNIDKDGADIVKNKTNKEIVIGILKDNPSMTLDEVSRIMGITRDGVKKIVDKLKSEGEIIRKGSTKKGEWIVVK